MSVAQFRSKQECCLPTVILVVSMTKVHLHYPLVRPLGDSDFDAVARATSYYGIVSVKVAASLDSVDVDYDSSRLTGRDVEAALRKFGLPIARQ